MPELKVECPKCGEETGTNRSIESQKFFQAMGTSEQTTKCDNCGDEVAWTKGDVINKDSLS